MLYDFYLYILNFLFSFCQFIFIHNFSIEYVFLQFILIYIFFLFFSNTNMYYSLLYLFLEIFYFGIVLSFNQVELFTGFLWVVEYIVIFVFLLMLFYINSQGDFKVNKNYLYKYSYLIIIIIFLFFYPLTWYNNFTFIINLYTITYWDDYYESFNNLNMNDFVGLYISYFTFNSLEYILIGFLLFLGSLLCICLFRLTKVIKFKNYKLFFKTFKLTQSYNFSTFMRKQNLNKQANTQPSLKKFTSKNFKDND